MTAYGFAEKESAEKMNERATKALQNLPLYGIIKAVEIIINESI